MKKPIKKERTVTPVFKQTLPKLAKIASELHIKYGRKYTRQETIEFLVDKYNA